MLQGKCVFFARFYCTLSCVKQFKDEYKKFLLIIFLNLIILIMPTTMRRNFILAGEGWGVLPSSRLQWVCAASWGRIFWIDYYGAAFL